jgi:hypothetical protein
MKTFRKFCDESTALDRHMDKLKKEYDSEDNLMKKVRTVDRMREIEQKLGGI